MPWISENITHQRLHIIQTLLSGELTVTQASRKVPVSRKTLYKWLDRYRIQGPAGLVGRSTARITKTHRLNEDQLQLLFQKKAAHPTWGARKLIHLMPRDSCGLRTLERALARAGLTKRRCRRALPGPRKLRTHRLSIPHQPNEVWTVDFKGWFRTADGSRCDPLTVRDLYSRFGLAVVLVTHTNEHHVRRVFIRLFRRWGLPKVIRVDNGTPFAATHSGSPYHWSALSLWWTRLGITVEMTRRGKPQDNGAHEQFHAVYQSEVVRARCSDPKDAQRRSNRWLEVYNYIRPHDALGQRRPADLYRSCRRRYRPVVLHPAYPASWKKVRVTTKGYIRHHGRLRLLSRILSRLHVGLRPVGQDIHEVYIDRILVGTLHEHDAAGMRPASYLYAKKLSPM